MPFSWLPDATLDSHPRLTWFAESCFDLVILSLYRREAILPPNFRLEPGTLVVSNHQRDSDGPILGTVLCQRRGLRMQNPLPFFAAREDLFRPGILAEYAARWPRPLRIPLKWIPLTWFFHIVRVYPLRRLREFTLGETLTALVNAGYGETDCAALLNARGLREAGAESGALPLQLVRKRRGVPLITYWGLRRLRRNTLAALAPGFRATIAAQLRFFAQRLDAGRCVYLAPEGVTSTTGRFGRVRGGAWCILQLVSISPPVLPLALSYDALRPGRLRVLVHVGTPLRGIDSDDRRHFDARLSHEIRKLYAVNTSHLISQFLVAGPEEFTGKQFADWLRRARTAVAIAGLRLDPLLENTAPETLADERLAWLARKRLIARRDAGWRNRWPRNAQPGWSSPADRVRYYANALADLAPELERTLTP